MKRWNVYTTRHKHPPHVYSGKKMQLKSTSKFSCQAWTVSFVSLLVSGLGLAQVGLGAWIWIFSESFALVLDSPMRNVILGFMSIGALAFIICGIGIVVALLRNKRGLIVCMVLMVASTACQAGVWAFVYLEQQKISQLFETRIQFHIQYYEFFNSEFNCSLQLGVLSTENVEYCAMLVSMWMWKVVWGMLGLCAILICFQIVLIVMNAMMHQLIRKQLNRSKVTFIQRSNMQEFASTSPHNVHETSVDPPSEPQEAEVREDIKLTRSEPPLHPQRTEGREDIKLTRYEPSPGFPPPPATPSPQSLGTREGHHTRTQTERYHSLQINAVINNTSNTTTLNRVEEGAKWPNSATAQYSKADHAPRPAHNASVQNGSLVTWNHSNANRLPPHVHPHTVYRHRSIIEL